MSQIGELYMISKLALVALMMQWLPCEISSYHGGEYDVQSCLLGCTAV
jgi:hypothetical protein